MSAREDRGAEAGSIGALPDWRAFVLAHGHGAPLRALAAVLGREASEVQRVRNSGACVRDAPKRTFSELFTLWHGRAPADGDWPVPERGAAGGYEWQLPELALLAAQVGQNAVALFGGLGLGVAHDALGLFAGAGLHVLGRLLGGDDRFAADVGRLGAGLVQDALGVGVGALPGDLRLAGVFQPLGDARLALVEHAQDRLVEKGRQQQDQGTDAADLRQQVT